VFINWEGLKVERFISTLVIILTNVWATIIPLGPFAVGTIQPTAYLQEVQINNIYLDQLTEVYVASNTGTVKISQATASPIYNLAIRITPFQYLLMFNQTSETIYVGVDGIITRET
jgi:hypothetical protein